MLQQNLNVGIPISVIVKDVLLQSSLMKTPLECPICKKHLTELIALLNLTGYKLRFLDKLDEVLFYLDGNFYADSDSK